MSIDGAGAGRCAGRHGREIVGLRRLLQPAILALALLVSRGMARSSDIGGPVNLHESSKDYNSPFDLFQLKRVSTRNQNTLYDAVRTRPEFFENALNVHDSHAVFINENRWQRVKSCGLFSNLTARGVVQPDLTTKILVSGYELPSRVITPEISAKMDGATPVICGTLRYMDKNFNGLGQRLRVSLTGKEKVSATLDSLTTDPIRECEWEDYSVSGERIAVGCRQNYCFDTFRRFGSVGVLSRPTGSSSPPAGTELKAAENSAFLRLSRSFLSTANMVGDWSLRLFGTQLDNCASKVNSSIFPVQMTGARAEIKLRREDPSGQGAVKLWGESGVSCSHSQANSFHRVGASIFQKFSLRQPFSVTEKSTVKNSEPVSLLFQLKGMLSHGGGLIPHFHYESLSGNIVRGHKPSSSSQCPLCERDDSAMSYVAAKIDILHSCNNGITPGIFVDCAAYNSRLSECELCQSKGKVYDFLRGFSGSTATTGLSLRYRNFKVELPMGLLNLYRFTRGQGPMPKPSVHFGLDIFDT